MFNREAMLASDWYQARLKSQQEHDIQAWEGHVQYLQHFLQKDSHRNIAGQLHIEERLSAAKARLEHVNQASYPDELRGSIGRQPIPIAFPA
jgi:hypothetical protein